MKIAVLGATGQIGSLVVAEALTRGFDTVAVTRSPTRSMVGDHFECRVGDVTDARFLAEATRDCGSVISCIGQRRTSPIAKSSSPPTILSSVMRALIDAIGSDDSRRVIYTSAFGVGDDLKRHAVIFKAVLRVFTIGEAYRDHDAAERLLEASQVRWTIVRPVGLTDQKGGEPAVDLGTDWSSFSTVSREAVARYLLDCLTRNDVVRRTVTIGKRR